MARKTKSPRFAVYEDSGLASPELSCRPILDGTLRAHQGLIDNSVGHCNDDVFEISEEVQWDLMHGDATLLHHTPDNKDEQDSGNDELERRASELTSTSISSFPESTTDLRSRKTDAIRPPYSAPIIRPSFRRVSSVRRMQMTSPTPFDRRRSVLHRHSRPTTPRSNPQASLRRQKSEDGEDTEDEKDYPLVLLHVTMLPLELQWSREVVHELLPEDIMHNLHQLSAKLSDIIVQRGVLIQHPREEYGLLEERLLQALELKNDRISKCGHFRARDSISSVLSSSEGSDSGIGSDSEVCLTCHQQLESSKSGVAGKKTWNIRVFAANGLLGPSAWAAAWADMERVDVEILPWIDGNLRRALNARQEEFDAEERLGQEEEEARIRQIVEEQVRIAHDGLKSTTAGDPCAPVPRAWPLPEDSALMNCSASPERQQQQKGRPSDLPQIYRPKDIPLSILLQNYIILLARDPKIVAIFVLLAMVLLLTLRGMIMGAQSGPAIVPSVMTVPDISSGEVFAHENISNATMRAMDDQEQAIIFAKMNDTKAEVATTKQSDDIAEHESRLEKATDSLAIVGK